MATNAKRIEVTREGAFTFRDDNLHKILKEIDARLAGYGCYSTVVRFTSGTNKGLIERIEIYSDQLKTKLDLTRELTYTNGRITGVIDTYLNSDLSEDSLVTTTITRDGDGLIIGCESVFSTTEDTGC